MRQVDQINCGECGPLVEGGCAADYRKDLAWARKHAKTRKHLVHVLYSDSIHYDGRPASGGEEVSEARGRKEPVEDGWTK